MANGYNIFPKLYNCALAMALCSIFLLAGALYVPLKCSAAHASFAKSSSKSTSKDTGISEKILQDINSGRWLEAQPKLEQVCVQGKPAAIDFWLAFDYLFLNQCDKLKLQADRVSSAAAEAPYISKLVQAVNLSCLGKYGEAQQILVSVEQPPDTPSKVALQFALAMVAGKREQYTDAVEHLQQVVQLAPDFAWGYRTLGYVQLRPLKDFTAAEEPLHKALILCPALSEVRDLLVDAKLAHNDFDGAIEIAQQAIKLAPKDSVNYYRLAQIYLLQWRLSDASVQLRKAIALSPDDARLYRAQAHVFRHQGDFAAAIVEQQKAVDSAKNKAPELNELATLNLDAGNALKAIDNLKQALQVDPASAYLQQRLCLVLNQQKLYDELVVQYRKMLAQKPQDFNLNLSLARALRNAGKADDAIDLYKSASQLHPSAATPHEELAAIYLDRKDFPRAIAEYTRALNNNPSSVEDLVALGYAYAQNSDYLQAEAAFVTALALQQLTQPAKDTTTPISRLDLMRSLSALYLVESRYPEAVTQFEAITTSEKGSHALPEDQFLLSVSRVYRDRTTAASGQLLTAFSALPGDRQQRVLPSVIEALVETGNSQSAADLVKNISTERVKSEPALMCAVAAYQRASGDLAAATTLLQGAIIANPTDPQVRCDLYIELSRVLLRSGDVTSAEDAAVKAVEATPKSFKAYEQLGRVYEAKHDLVNASRTCKQGIDINPYYAPAYLLYGDILLAKGNVNDAIDQYRRASELYPAWSVPHTQLQKCKPKAAAASSTAQHTAPGRSASKGTKKILTPTKTKPAPTGTAVPTEKATHILPVNTGTKSPQGSNR